MGYYTAARFARDPRCSKCDGELVVVPDRDRALIQAAETQPEGPELGDLPVPAR